VGLGFEDCGRSEGEGAGLTICLLWFVICCLLLAGRGPMLRTAKTSP
jgi:hypothetical protein